ncbi:MAG TPA: MucB/RseB C-terminal domain-containing protein [Burkholderiaceae bacterium]|nr:MucB/RseB C-terminal domain-containing protein [Burkholderiaceae bacterium]
MAGIIAGALISAVAWADEALPRGAAEPASAVLDARVWLKRIQDSTYRRSFTGTFVVSSGGAMSSARITHYCDGHSQIERVDALDGQLRSVFRHDDVVHTLWPASRQAVVEQREPLRGFPALVGGGGRHGALAYEALPERVDRIAGHEAQVLLLKSRDDLRFSQRLWSEKNTGLLLRADTLGAQGEVLESSAFSELALGARLQPALLMQEMNRLEGYRVLRPVTVRTDLAREGWVLREAVPGFVSLSCIKRPLEPTAAQVPEQGAFLLQAIYSDGLTHVSIFIEPGETGSGRLEGLSTQGATSSLSARRGDWWITVVGDVPAATLRRFAASIERRKP